MNRRFSAYDGANFTSEILPVIPSGSTISPQSPSFGALERGQGKIPGKKRPHGWVGYANWSDALSTSTDLELWESWGASVGMQGRKYPALDIDVDEPDLAQAIEDLAFEYLGSAPVRFGRGARRVLVYSAEGLTKRRVAFRPIKPSVGGDDQAIEFLGDGQYYVVEGVHPKTGQPYYWREGRSPVEVGPSGLTSITLDQLDEFYGRLNSFLEREGCQITQRVAYQGGRTRNGVWQEGLRAPNVDAVGRALAAVPNDVDRHTWLKIGAAVKASAGPEAEGEAFAMWEDWSLQWADNTPESVADTWRSLTAPFAVGWDFLSAYATYEGDGTFHAAEEDFDAVAEAPPEGEESKGPPVSPKVERMFENYVWVERLERVCDLRTSELLTRTMFNVRNSHIGPPTSNTECAWAVLVSNPKRLRKVKGVTYRPGGELIVTENLPGLTGPCVNRWRDPAPDLPASATDEDVKVWLDHVAFIVPDERERGIVLDWLAWIAQNPGQKPNWCLVIGSTAEGMGKDLMLDPVRAAIGEANVREIGPEDLASGNTDYLENTRLLLVEEMEMHERKSMMNKLKPVIAAPPHTLRVNIKYQPQFHVPNLIAAVFFTNMENALSLSRLGRRYFVTWNDGTPMPEEYYVGLAAWFEKGGSAMAARWLLQRDVSGFNAKGRAPDTLAREEMRKASRSRLEELIEDGLAEGDGVLGRRVMSLDEIGAYIREQLHGERISNGRIAATLRKSGCVKLGRMMVGRPPAGCAPLCGKQTKAPTLFVAEGDDLVGADRGTILAAIWAERPATADPDAVFDGGAAQ